MTRKLKQRAMTIKRKADELFRLIYAEFGEDDYASDLADNLTCAADDLIDCLSQGKLEVEG